jgi:hypothetical protein
MSGSAELVKFMLGLPGVSVKIRDESTVNNANSSGLWSQVRRDELHAMVGESGAGTKNATALHFACLAGHWDVIQVLVEQGGADFEVKDEQGRMPVEYFRMDGGMATNFEVLRDFEGAYKRWKAVRERLEPGERYSWLNASVH